MAGVKVGPGDVILIGTGRWTRREKEGFGENSAGLYGSCLQWRRQRDTAIVDSDLALDGMPVWIKEIRIA